MNKLIQTLVLAVIALTALIAAGPTLVGLVHALVSLVLAAGVVVAVLQLIRYFGRR